MQSQHKQHRKTSHSQHTGQHSVGLHRRTSRIPAQPSAPVPPLPTLLSEAFSTEGIPAQNRKRKTATKPAAAATVQTYVQTMSQREANNVLLCVRLLLPLLAPTAVHLLRKIMMCVHEVHAVPIFQTSQLEGNGPKVCKQALKQGFGLNFYQCLSIHVIWISAVNCPALVE